MSSPAQSIVTAAPSRRMAWLNGALVPAESAAVSLFDHGLLYGDGVFEGIRTFDRRPFALDAHLDRLERSARFLDLTIPYSRAELKAAVSAVIAGGDAGSQDEYLRVVVTRGAGDLGLDPRSCPRATVFVLAAPVRVFSADAATTGVDVIVSSFRQGGADGLDARVKSLNYLTRILARLEANRAGAAEAILLDGNGHLTEGTADNVLLVRDGVLLSPPPIAGGLEGITRAGVLTIAAREGIPAREAALGRYDLINADEALLVGTGAGLVPIRRVEGKALPACPGPISAKLLTGYQQLVRQPA